MLLSSAHVAAAAAVVILLFVSAPQGPVTSAFVTPSTTTITSRTTALTRTTALRCSAVVTTRPGSGTPAQENNDNNRRRPPPQQLAQPAVQLSEEDYLRRLEVQLEKLRQKDLLSPLLTKEQLSIVYEDDHIVVIDKPAGVLTVSGKNGAHSIAETVYQAIANEFPDADRMVVHRLGMDTSGLLILAKTLEAVRGLNTLFRTRTVERRYEALVCGHVQRNRGIVDLPLMRCYEYPPYVRISTDEHQEALLGLDPSVVGKQILEAPKESLTKYEVISREELGGQPVTRVTLTSLSGRTHQLNVHLAALGHPIVGDTVYGCGVVPVNDDDDSVCGTTAAPNGGLTDDELRYLVAHNRKHRATLKQQRDAARAVQGRPQVHAKSLKFRHPVLKQDIVLESKTPF